MEDRLTLEHNKHEAVIKARQVDFDDRSRQLKKQVVELNDKMRN